MEHLQNIQSVIAYFSDLYSSWQEVNRLFINMIHNPGSGSLTMQESLYEFYHKYMDAKVFQTNLLNLILTSSAEKESRITTPLLVLLQENIFLYKENKEVFETRKELSELSGEEEKERKRVAPFGKNFFPEIYQLSKELA
ncbi:MAG: hypothetical protein Q8N05_04070 [Bacteroidota bacterium]|nr:hypothetical protein [Bacteroidota bacterium]